jgi:hypothetical protein
MKLEEHPLRGMALFVGGGTSLTMATLLVAVASGPAGWALLGLAGCIAFGCLLGGKC